MYDVPYYKANDWQTVKEFMYNNRFVTIVGTDENGYPVATHVPILIEEVGDKIYLQGHFMQKQAHTKAFVQNNKALVIFLSPHHSYISATNYTQKNVASTWNYQAVHASGNVHFISEQDLLKQLHLLTKHFEKKDSTEALVENIDEEYIQRNIKAIVGFKIEIDKVEHIFKLSQDKHVEEQHNIIHQLKSSESCQHYQLAQAMKKENKL
jgi:transcriptional regulator